MILELLKIRKDWGLSARSKVVVRKAATDVYAATIDDKVGATCVRACVRAWVGGGAFLVPCAGMLRVFACKCVGACWVWVWVCVLACVGFLFVLVVLRISAIGHLGTCLRALGPAALTAPTPPRAPLSLRSP